MRAVYAERVGDGRGFRRGLSIESGEKTLIVDDILTTGGSVVDVLKAVKEAGGEVVGVGVLIDRSGGGVEVGAPLYCCHTVEVPTYRPEECPACREGVKRWHVRVAGEGFNSAGSIDRAKGPDDKIEAGSR